MKGLQRRFSLTTWRLCKPKTCNSLAWPDPIFCRRAYVNVNVNTTCDFERGGAKKPIIGSGSSWNNGEKPWLPRWKRFYLFIFLPTAHTHGHTPSIALPAPAAHARGVTICTELGLGLECTPELLVNRLVNLDISFLAKFRNLYSYFVT